MEHLSMGLMWSGSIQLFKGPLMDSASPVCIPTALRRAWHREVSWVLISLLALIITENCGENQMR